LFNKKLSKNAAQKAKSKKGSVNKLTLEAPVVLHYLKAPTAVKWTAVWFIAFQFISC
jgi:hypothetical protein